MERAVGLPGNRINRAPHRAGERRLEKAISSDQQPDRGHSRVGCVCRRAESLE